MEQYLVTVKKDIYDGETGVEIAGLFDADKVGDAKEKVTNWLEKNGFEDYEVFSTLYIPNQLRWYEIEENL